MPPVASTSASVNSAEELFDRVPPRTVLLEGGVFDHESRSAHAENPLAGTVLAREPHEGHTPCTPVMVTTASKNSVGLPHAAVEHRTATAVECESIRVVMVTRS